MSRFFSLLIIGLLLTGSAGAEITSQIIVKFKRPGGVSASSVRSLVARYSAAPPRQLFAAALKVRPDWRHLADVYVVTLPPTGDAWAIAREFQKDSNVLSAAPDSKVWAFDVTPNDPGYSQQWGLPQIRANKAWVKTTGTSEVLVAVLDTGLNYNHEDFNGKVNMTYARNFVADPVSGEADPADDYGHGTAVSGVIGAVSNNGTGITGLDWQCKIVPIKVLNALGGGDISTVSAALEYLAGLKSRGVNIAVANMSLGQYNDESNPSRYEDEDPSLIRESCQDAYNQGIVLVAAAGNGGVDWNTYPAIYPTVLAVAATDTNDQRSVWTGTDSQTGRTRSSNYGRTGVAGYADNLGVDVTAPGSGIYTTDMNGSYSGGWNGTSLAAPYVAGLAALIRGLSPTLTAEAVMAEIRNTAWDIDPLNPGYESKLGSGRIDAYQALAGVISRLTSPANGDHVRGAVEIRGIAGGWNFKSYRLEALQGSTVEATINNSLISVESGTLGTWDTAGLNGQYTIRLSVVTNDLITDEATVEVVVDNISPEAAITSPVSGAVLIGQITISGKARDAHQYYYDLEYGSGSSPASFQRIGRYYASVESGALGTWETSGLSGYYTIRLTAWDRSGNSSSASVLTQVASITPTREIEPQTGLPLTYALPNPFNLSTTSETTIAYELKGNFDTTIYLFDLNGSLIWSRRFAAGENGAKSGLNNPGWDGRSLFAERVPNGVYCYQISAEKKIIGRGKIIVLN
jgi:subtilisin family serine protease